MPSNVVVPQSLSKADVAIVVDGVLVAPLHTNGVVAFVAVVPVVLVKAVVLVVLKLWDESLRVVGGRKREPTLA